MLHFKVVCCLFLTCLLVHYGLGQIDKDTWQWESPRMQERLPPLANSTSQFGFALFRSLSPTADNIICSPLNIYQGLTVMLRGVRGSTKEETTATLEQQNQQGVHITLQALSESLPSPSMTKNMLRAADSLYYSENIKLKSRFASMTDWYGLSSLRKFVFPGPETEINTWVSNVTEGKITDFMPARVLPRDVTLLLVSGVFFQGSWNIPKSGLGKFTVPSKTPVFTTVLNIVAPFALQSLGSSLGARILELPYDDGRLSLYIILPDDVAGLPAVESKLDGQILENALRKTVSKQLVDVKLPAFKLKTRGSLKPTLQDVGIEKLFNQSSDFKRLSTDAAYLYDFRHFTFLEVAEGGPFSGSNPTPPPTTAAPNATFHALSPFLLVVRDNKAKINLMLGRLKNPGSSSNVI